MCGSGLCLVNVKILVKDKRLNKIDWLLITQGSCLFWVVRCHFLYVTLENVVPPLSSQSQSLYASFLPFGASKRGDLHKTQRVMIDQ